jgi:hypothetical protein
MTRQIIIDAGEVSLMARLTNSETANAIWEALPLSGSVSRWGEEIYFTIPVTIPESEDARQDMDPGELGYWPQGSAFCIFFGPTPASIDERPRAYSNVNPFGHVEGDAKALRSVSDGDDVTVRKDEPESS